MSAVGLCLQACHNSPSSSLSLEVVCVCVDLWWVSSTTKTVWYVLTHKPPSVSVVLLCRGRLADNKHLSALTDQWIYSFINVWFGDMVKQFPPGGHFVLFSALSTRQTASDDDQAPASVWSLTYAVEWVIFSGQMSTVLPVLTRVWRTRMWWWQSLCGAFTLLCLFFFFFFFWGKETSHFQQVEDAAARQCVQDLCEGLCGPHTFSVSSPLTPHRPAPTPTTDVFTRSHRHPWGSSWRKWSSGKHNILKMEKSFIFQPWTSAGCFHFYAVSDVISYCFTRVPLVLSPLTHFR